VSAAAPPQAGARKERLDPEFIKLAVILLVGVVMVAFDTTIVNVAINDIAQGPAHDGVDRPVDDQRLPARSRHSRPRRGAGQRALRCQASLDRSTGTTARSDHQQPRLSRTGSGAPCRYR
jgi:hypothetical protein